jgi:cellulose synthase/poly-beta-1,6-N-acetylglucosamine synthase-like glycosyltransferase
MDSPKLTLLKIKHVGLSASRNTAIKHCNGDYIAFVDGDAKAKIDWLSNIDKAVSSSDSDTKVFAGAVNSLNQNSFMSNFIYQSHVKASIDVSTGSKLIGANMVFKRDVLDSVMFLDGMVRGDETSLLARYKLKNPSCKELYVKDAVVLNDYPDKLGEWVKVAFTEGMMRAVIDREFVKQSHLKLFAETSLRFLFLVSIFLVVFSTFFMGDNLFLTIGCSSIILLRLYRTGQYFKKGIINTLNHYRHFAILSPLVGVLLFICRDFGVLVNTITKSRKQKVELCESTSTVLDKVLVS